MQKREFYTFKDVQSKGVVNEGFQFLKKNGHTKKNSLYACKLLQQCTFRSKGTEKHSVLLTIYLINLAK